MFALLVLIKIFFSSFLLTYTFSNWEKKNFFALINLEILGLSEFTQKK